MKRVRDHGWGSEDAHGGLGPASASGWVVGGLLGGCRHPMVARGRRIAAANADPLPALPSDVQPLLPADPRRGKYQDGWTKVFFKCVGNLLPHVDF